MSMEPPSDGFAEAGLAHSGLVHDLLEVEQRLDALEAEFQQLTDRDRGHARAKSQEANETVEVGERYKTVVFTPPEENDGTHAITKIDGLYTFVDAGTESLDRGDFIEIRIADVGRNHAEAVVLGVLSTEADSR